MPFFWLFVIVFWAYFTKSEQKRKILSKYALFFIMVFGNLFLASKVMKWWEPKPMQDSAMSNFKVAVVLGGGIINEDKWPYDRVHFDPSADRLLQAFQLYKLGKIQKILISAGPITFRNSSIVISEANLGKQFLIQTGVDSTDILVENKSKTTYDNAVFSKKILINNNLLDSEVLLVTSAYHMKRSMACFEKQGVKVVAFPACYQQVNIPFFTFSLIVPDETAFSFWYDLFHEWYGIAIYKVLGYI